MQIFAIIYFTPYIISDAKRIYSDTDLFSFNKRINVSIYQNGQRCNIRAEKEYIHKNFSKLPFFPLCKTKEIY